MRYGTSKEEEYMNLWKQGFRKRKTKKKSRVKPHTEQVKRRRVSKVREEKREVGRRFLKQKTRVVTKERQIRTKRTKRKPQKIEGAFKKSIAKLVIPDILPIGTSEINNEYRKLFANVIRDKDIMDLMIAEENIQKLKHRFEIRGNIYGLRGEKLAEFSNGEGKDLIELKNALNNNIWQGQNLEGYENKEEFMKDWNFRFLQKGNVNRVEVTVVFRS